MTDGLVNIVRELLPRLCDFKQENHDTLFIKFRETEALTGIELAKIITYICNCGADEIDSDDEGWIRLWWD